MHLQDIYRIFPRFYRSDEGSAGRARFLETFSEIVSRPQKHDDGGWVTICLISSLKRGSATPRLM